MEYIDGDCGDGRVTPPVPEHDDVVVHRSRPRAPRARRARRDPQLFPTEGPFQLFIVFATLDGLWQCPWPLERPEDGLAMEIPPPPPLWIRAS